MKERRLIFICDCTDYPNAQDRQQTDNYSGWNTARPSLPTEFDVDIGEGGSGVLPGRRQLVRLLVELDGSVLVARDAVVVVAEVEERFAEVDVQLGRLSTHANVVRKSKQHTI